MNQRNTVVTGNDRPPACTGGSAKSTIESLDPPEGNQVVTS